MSVGLLVDDSIDPQLSSNFGFQVVRFGKVEGDVRCWIACGHGQKSM